MQRLAVIRYAILILVRDVSIPAGGLWIAIHGISTGTLSPWHLPLIAGMLGTPLVGRGETPPGPDKD